MLALLLLAQIGSGPNLMLEPPGLTPATAAQLEQTLVSEPENLDARIRLLRYYFLQAMPAQRAGQIFWMIEHHPESNLHGQTDLMMRPRVDAINTPADYDHGKLLWARALERQPDNGPVLINAARYLFVGDPFEAEKLLLRARRMPVVREEATRMLVSFYSYAINTELSAGVGAVYDSSAPAAEFREHVSGLLAHINEAIFPGRVGLSMVQPTAFPPNSPPPPEVLDLYRRRNEYGVKLLQRAQMLEPKNPEWRALSTPPSFEPAKPAENLPVVTYTVAPAYPPLAAQARIQAVVKLRGVVGPNGEMTNLSLVSGHPLLVQAAQDAARQSRHPDRVGQTIFIEVPFRLP